MTKQTLPEQQLRFSEFIENLENAPSQLNKDKISIPRFASMFYMMLPMEVKKFLQTRGMLNEQMVALLSERKDYGKIHGAKIDEAIHHGSVTDMGWNLQSPKTPFSPFFFRGGVYSELIPGAEKARACSLKNMFSDPTKALVDATRCSMGWFWWFICYEGVWVLVRILLYCGPCLFVYELVGIVPTPEFHVHDTQSVVFSGEPTIEIERSPRYFFSFLVMKEAVIDLVVGHLGKDSPKERRPVIVFKKSYFVSDMTRTDVWPQVEPNYAPSWHDTTFVSNVCIDRPLIAIGKELEIPNCNAFADDAICRLLTDEGTAKNKKQQKKSNAGSSTVPKKTSKPRKGKKQPLQISNDDMDEEDSDHDEEMVEVTKTTKKSKEVVSTSKAITDAATPVAARKKTLGIRPGRITSRIYFRKESKSPSPSPKKKVVEESEDENDDDEEDNDEVDKDDMDEDADSDEEDDDDDDVDENNNDSANKDSDDEENDEDYNSEDNEDGDDDDESDGSDQGKNSSDEENDSCEIVKASSLLTAQAIVAPEEEKTKEEEEGEVKDDDDDDIVSVPSPTPTSTLSTTIMDIDEEPSPSASVKVKEEPVFPSLPSVSVAPISEAPMVVSEESSSSSSASSPSASDVEDVNIASSSPILSKRKSPDVSDDEVDLDDKADEPVKKKAKLSEVEDGEVIDVEAELEAARNLEQQQPQPLQLTPEVTSSLKELETMDNVANTAATLSDSEMSSPSLDTSFVEPKEVVVMLNADAATEKPKSVATTSMETDLPDTVLHEAYDMDAGVGLIVPPTERVSHVEGLAELQTNAAELVHTPLATPMVLIGTTNSQTSNSESSELDSNSGSLLSKLLAEVSQLRSMVVNLTADVTNLKETRTSMNNQLQQEKSSRQTILHEQTSSKSRIQANALAIEKLTNVCKNMGAKMKNLQQKQQQQLQLQQQQQPLHIQHTQQQQQLQQHPSNTNVAQLQNQSVDYQQHVAYQQQLLQQYASQQQNHQQHQQQQQQLLRNDLSRECAAGISETQQNLRSIDTANLVSLGINPMYAQPDVDDSSLLSDLDSMLSSWG